MAGRLIETNQDGEFSHVLPQKLSEKEEIYKRL